MSLRAKRPRRQSREDMSSAVAGSNSREPLSGQPKGGQAQGSSGELLSIGACVIAEAEAMVRDEAFFGGGDNPTLLVAKADRELQLKRGVRRDFQKQWELERICLDAELDFEKQENKKLRVENKTLQKRLKAAERRSHCMEHEMHTCRVEMKKMKQQHKKKLEELGKGSDPGLVSCSRPGCRPCLAIPAIPALAVAEAPSPSTWTWAAGPIDVDTEASVDLGRCSPGQRCIGPWPLHGHYIAISCQWLMPESHQSKQRAREKKQTHFRGVIVGWRGRKYSRVSFRLARLPLYFPKPSTLKTTTHKP